MDTATLQSPLIFGEVLFDRFPDGVTVQGGAPFNVARHLQAFGVSPLFISRVGNDLHGQQVKTSMLSWGMDTSGLQIDAAHPTGTVEVGFADQQPQYDIVNDCAYDFIDAASLPLLHPGGLIYHGCLAVRNETSAKTLQKIKQTTAAPAFIDINLRAPWWSIEMVEQLLREARWLKLNEDELAAIAPQQNNTLSRAKHLLCSFPLKLLVITQGEAGAFAVTADGKPIHVLPDKNTSVVDTVGAGDAFCSVLLLGQIRNWPLQLTLQRAQQFASASVGIRGATCHDRNFYLAFIDRWT